MLVYLYLGTFILSDLESSVSILILTLVGRVAAIVRRKVSAVASKLTTVSVRDMIKAMIAGERDPRTRLPLREAR